MRRLAAVRTEVKEVTGWTGGHSALYIVRVQSLHVSWESITVQFKTVQLQVMTEVAWWRSQCPWSLGTVQFPSPSAVRVVLCSAWQYSAVTQLDLLFQSLKIFQANKDAFLTVKKTTEISDNLLQRDNIFIETLHRQKSSVNLTITSSSHPRYLRLRCPSSPWSTRSPAGSLRVGRLWKEPTRKLERNLT